MRWEGNVLTPVCVSVYRGGSQVPVSDRRGEGVPVSDFGGYPVSDFQGGSQSQILGGTQSQIFGGVPSLSKGKKI